MSDMDHHNPSSGLKNKNQRGLGRGLANLLSSTVKIPSTDSQGADSVTLKVSQVPIEALQPSTQQPRTIFDETALDELASSIREHGVLQPIVVSEIKDTGQYKIIAGERRYRASKKLGLKTIPAIIREPLSPDSSFEIALIENIQRANLSAIEEAKAYQILLDEYNISQEELAKRVGKERSSITNALRILKLHPSVIHALEDNTISVGHAKVLCGIPFEQQPSMLTTIEKRKLSVRGLEDLVQHASTGSIKNTKQKQQVTNIDPQYEHCRRAAEELLSMKIKIVPTSKDSGQVVFHYHSLEALTELFEIIDVK